MFLELSVMIYHIYILGFQYFDVAGRSIPLGYMGTSEDVVPTVVFLASDKAEFVTGAVIAVDGGYVCTCCMP